MKQPVNALAALPVALAVAASALTACSVAGGAEGDTEVITVGYQSKTINTVTAGTLLRERGYFEQRLEELGKKTGKTYRVDWQDYDTGAPITAQMVAGKIDIGSMGDYPLLINGSRRGHRRARHGAGLGDRLQPARRAQRRGRRAGLAGQDAAPTSRAATISASVGSAGHGTLVQALDAGGARPGARRRGRRTSSPRSAPRRSRQGRCDAVAQFVAWPGLLVFQDKAPAAVRRRRGSTCRRCTASWSARRSLSQRRGRRRRVPPGPARRHRLPAPAPAGGRRGRREGDRPAARGRLPLQRRGRDLDVRPDAQARAGRRAPPRCAVPEVHRRC